MIVFLAALIVLTFFWGCEYDSIVTVFGGVILVASAAAIFLQNKKINQLEGQRGQRQIGRKTEKYEMKCFSCFLPVALGEIFKISINLQKKYK